ncbi:MAG: hypothetical protein JWO38_5332 [Gemmataceae bacterium]|nr:hypothetical protein [Gemmataceae bacterium]
MPRYPCSAELQLWLCLTAFPAGTRLTDVLTDLEAMSLEEKRDFNRGVHPHFNFGFHDIRVELRQLLATHGNAVTVDDFVAVE